MRVYKYILLIAFLSSAAVLPAQIAPKAVFAAVATVLPLLFNRNSAEIAISQLPKDGASGSAKGPAVSGGTEGGGNGSGAGGGGGKTAGGLSADSGGKDDDDDDEKRPPKGFKKPAEYDVGYKKELLKAHHQEFLLVFQKIKTLGLALRKDESFPSDRVTNARIAVRQQSWFVKNMALVHHVEGGMVERVAIIRHAREVLEREYDILLASKEAYEAAKEGKEPSAKRKRR